MAIRPGAAIAFDDVCALAGGILQHAFEVVESRVGDLAAVKEELLGGCDEVAGCELTQQFVVDVTLDRAARAPAEMPIDQQTHMIARLQFNNL